MSAPLATRAPAKINLTLRVLGRRADGYHELESLVAFAGTGDDLRLEPGPSLALDVTGPTASFSGRESDNLVLKAARLLTEHIPGLKIGTFHLIKRLPVAAGIGGGSSDAAAALRLLARLNDVPLSDPIIMEAARLTGADVPVCIESRARIMRGVGELLGPVMRLPRLFSVIVNPDVPVATPDVFRAFGMRAGETRAGSVCDDLTMTSSDGFIEALRHARNDLEPAATSLQPVIGEALSRLSQTDGCRLVRMSGSGATVFGLFGDCAAAAAAAKRLQSERPTWWVKSSLLR